MKLSFRELHRKGVGAVKAQAEIITPEEEKQLWDCGMMGTDNPTSLLHSVFYTLRGGEEHCNLKLSQLIFKTEPSENDSMQLVRYVTYNEYVSKNRPGGKKQLNLQNKSVCQYMQPSLGNRCHVYLLELYISKLLLKAKQKDLFYCKPMPKTPKDPNSPWYYALPIGHNQLQKMLKHMCSQAEIDTTLKSNHSLRATSISRLYNASVPEKTIMEKSGHLSKEGLRLYEHTSIQQKQEVCTTLAAFVPPENNNTSEHKPLFIQNKLDSDEKENQDPDNNDSVTHQFKKSTQLI